APEDALAARVPMRVLPEAANALTGLESRADAAPEREKARLLAAIEALRGAMEDASGVLRARSFRREDSGRIHRRDGPVQTIPRSVRSVIAPIAAGDVFVSADFRSAHVAIAAACTGDAALAELVRAPDAYQRLADKYLPGQQNARTSMKTAVLA